MAEQPQGEPTISLQELERYLRAHNVSPKCPHCGAEEWGHFTPQALEGVALARMGGDALVDPNHVLHALARVCLNCSYIWLIVRRSVADWLVENPEQTP